MPGLGPQALCLLDKCSKVEPHPNPSVYSYILYIYREIIDIFGGAPTSQHVREGLRTTDVCQFSPSITWVPGIELGSFGLVASAFTC